jgi:hypothetical protein
MNGWPAIVHPGGVVQRERRGYPSDVSDEEWALAAPYLALCRENAEHVTSADEQDRAQVGELTRQVQELTGDHVRIGYVDQGYTAESAAEAAEQH